MQLRTNDALRMFAEKVDSTAAETAAADRHFQTIRTRSRAFLRRQAVYSDREPRAKRGIVAAARTAASLEQLNSAAQTAYERADAAVRAETRSYYSEANRQWSYLFNRSI